MPLITTTIIIIIIINNNNNNDDNNNKTHLSVSVTMPVIIKCTAVNVQFSSPSIGSLY